MDCIAVAAQYCPEEREFDAENPAVDELQNEGAGWYTETEAYSTP